MAEWVWQGCHTLLQIVAHKDMNTIIQKYWYHNLKLYFIIVNPKYARQNIYLIVKCLLAVISWLNSCIAVLFISYSQAVGISFVRCLLAVKCIYACYQMYLCLLSKMDLLAVK